MGTKLDSYTELARRTIDGFVDDGEQWTRFLDTAAQNYKYTFAEQVLIFAQRPDATALAEYDFWSQKMGRYVKRGSKGIALIDDAGDAPRLRYVFDVSDTAMRADARPLGQWRLEDSQKRNVALELSKSYDADASVGFERQLSEIARNLGDAWVDDYGLDALGPDADDESREAFAQALGESVTRVLYARCGLATQGLRTHEVNIAQATALATPEAVRALGVATSALARDVLQAIGRATKSGNVSEEHEHERADEPKRREPESGDRTDAFPLGVHEEALSQGAQAGSLQRSPALGDAHISLNRDRRDGEEAHGGAHERVRRAVGSDREPQSPRSDEVGGAHEHLPGASGGNRDRRGHLQLNLGLDERTSDFIEPEMPAPFGALSLSPGDVEAELRRGSITEGGKLRIRALYERHPSSLDAIKFLKDEYGIGGHSITLHDGTRAFADYSARGLRVWTFEGTRREAMFGWPELERHLRVIALRDDYLTPNERKRFEETREELSHRLPLLADESHEPSLFDFDDDAPEVVTTRERTSVNTTASQILKNENDAASDYRYEVGDEVYLDGHAFEITEIGSANVRLLDQSLTYPIHRLESTETFERLLGADDRNRRLLTHDDDAQKRDERESIGDDRDDETKASEPAERTGENSPEISAGARGSAVSENVMEASPAQRATNFHITDDALGHGGPKAKYLMNVEAIRTLKTIEAENRPATPEEQETLSRYVGWGGIPDVFDDAKPSWAKEHVELKELLTEDEYVQARASTLNAHYTSPTVIKAIYEAIESFGFQSGNVLEPACGIGNFFGLLPESMNGSKLYGVELDTLSGRIAKLLYPEASIEITGFEKTDREDFFDLAIGNVPFGQYQVADKAFDRFGFPIHDYFFAKTLDQVRAGGIVAFVTSRYTMDKQKDDARRYIASRADLLGAIRLPDDAFAANAGTEVVTDILFLKKREIPSTEVPSWVEVGETPEGFALNRYFIDHPEMVLGEITDRSTQYGHDELTVKSFKGAELGVLLEKAVQTIHGTFEPMEDLSIDDADRDESSIDVISADPSVKNFSFALVGGEIYFREGSVMARRSLNATAAERVKAMIELRDCTRRLIDLQLKDATDDEVHDAQAELTILYDSFTKRFGALNSRANALAFADDSSYPLLCSLEILDEEGNLSRKADMFYERTIRSHTPADHADTAAEALSVSIAETGRVDVELMERLTGCDAAELIDELQGVIYKDFSQESAPYVAADEFLSGDIRKKLRAHESLLSSMNGDDERREAVRSNIEALESAKPKDLDATEIDVRLGATWVDVGYVEQFMHETFETLRYERRNVRVKYASVTGEWRVEGKTRTSYRDVAARTTYGTSRANAYRILEDTLNLRDVRIYDTVEDAEGKKHRVLNKAETTKAQQKQQMIKDAWGAWVWSDPERRHALTEKYNELFNAVRLRDYDGSHIAFAGMNPEITLREHQTNAIARILYGGNTLLAHEVGAGKTFEMAAAAMESKRLGLCTKSLFAVPNHLTEQWASEFLRLYPAANVLVAKKRDFERANRKKFCSRIATGNWDAVILGHSQLERIPLSRERQVRFLTDQIDEIERGIAEIKEEEGARYTIKQMEKTRKSLQARLEKLNNEERKDDVVTFEELGCDRLFVDEAHSYKNLFLYTKMRNVAGLSTSEAQKSSDMLLKCRYIDEITGGRGVVFATGTPVSNSMTELYTMMRYLQHDMLAERGLAHFDSWASVFGETVTAIELAPEGTGYRARTRFAKFHNVPELMTLWKEAADIKTADELGLEVPDVEFHNVVAKPTEHQREMVAALSERAAKVHNRLVDPSVDNMLKITSDGRKLGLDQRIINPLLPDDPGSKMNLCVKNILQIYREGDAEKLTQLVFCDLSTPKGATGSEGEFSVYDDIKTKLIAGGIPEDEIAFIHDANTEVRKKELFASVRAGTVRVLMGSTQKMGAGTNVQDRLIALHDLDCPWRPGDLEQRKGRIVRQGNGNPCVHIYRYVTENTFDAYLWQTVENKQKFISQIMTSKSPVRSCEDIDETALSYAEIKALCAGDARIKEKMDLDVEVARLKVLKSDFESQRFRLQDDILMRIPERIAKTEESIAAYGRDIETLDVYKTVDGEFAGMTVEGRFFSEKAEAGEAMLAACKQSKLSKPVEIGSYRGFSMVASFSGFDYKLTLRGAASHTVELGTSITGNLIRIDNALAHMPDRLDEAKERLQELRHQMDASKAELEKPFAEEAELAAKSARLAELNAALDMDGYDEQVVADDEDAPARDCADKTAQDAKRDLELVGSANERTPNLEPAPRTVLQHRESLRDARARITELVRARTGLGDHLVVGAVER